MKMARNSEIQVTDPLAFWELLVSAFQEERFLLLPGIVLSEECLWAETVSPSYVRILLRTP